MKFDLSKSALHRAFVRVIQALNEIAPEIIRWPNAVERSRSSREFAKLSGIPGVVGAIDGAYIPIKAPKEDAETYISRKCFYGITLA